MEQVGESAEMGEMGEMGEVDGSVNGRELVELDNRVR